MSHERNTKYRELAANSEPISGRLDCLNRRGQTPYRIDVKHCSSWHLLPKWADWYELAVHERGGRIIGEQDQTVFELAKGYVTFSGIDESDEAEWESYFAMELIITWLWMTMNCGVSGLVVSWVPCVRRVNIKGCGGSVVGSVPCVRRVTDSNPTPATT